MNQDFDYENADRKDLLERCKNFEIAFKAIHELRMAAFDEDFYVAKESARRIVACVSKFEGLTTDQIESMPVNVLQMTEFIDALNISRDTYRELCAELLAALNSAMKTAEFESHAFRSWHGEAAKAITNAEKLLGEIR